KIVVGGYTDNGAGSDFALVRYNTSGALDTSFGSGGKVTTAIGSGDDLGLATQIQPDGRIVLAGSAEVGLSPDFALARYNANGSLDNAFGSFGRVATDIASGSQDAAIGMVLQRAGTLVTPGYDDI